MAISMRHMLKTAALSSLLLASSVVSADAPPVYQVKITNLTNATIFTPIMVASHKKGVSIFELGSPASDDLIAIAEGGDTSFLAATLEMNPDVLDVKNTGDLLHPGDSVTVEVSATDGARFISLASMMLPTNDGFIAANSVKAPRHGAKTYFSPGYDAGSEENDELCDSIPGGGPCDGGMDSTLEVDGYVHIHRGIHGGGDLAADVYDWRNPVAKISITRKE